jgi:predicted GNAT superfamily acetyltransferase
MQPIPANATHFADILALNAASVQVLSPLSEAKLAQLHAHAAYHKVVVEDGRVIAFLLGFAPGVAYDSINYRWFEARYDDFLYVDRIVVGDGQRGRGLGALLYCDLFAAARERGCARVVCEYDIEPPNPASAAFHRRFGFVEVGTQRVADGSKVVSLQCMSLQPEQSPGG